MHELVIQEHLGRRIRRRRRLLGMTQVTLAADCGTSFQQIQKYETGAIAISAARLWDLACALGVPISYFYEGISTWGSDPPPRVEDEVARTFGELASPQRNVLLGLVDAIIKH